MSHNEHLSSSPDDGQAVRADELLDRMFEKTIEPAEIDELLAIWKCSPDIEAEAKDQLRIERLLQVSLDLKSTLTAEKLEELDATCRKRLNLPILEEDDFSTNPLSQGAGPEQPNIYTDAYFAAAANEEARRAKAIPTSSAKKAFTKDDRLKTSHVLLFLVLLLAFCVAVYTEFFVDPARKIEKPPEFRSIARIEAVLDVLWEDDEESFKEGQMIGTDSIRIRDGIVQLTFSSGVRVAVKGPADFRLNTRKKMFLGEGQLSATVPPEGKGFEVATPFLSVVDLGTEFLLDVGKNTVEAQTILGKIELNGIGEKKIELDKGKALRFDASGLISRFNTEPNRFLTDLFVLGMRDERDEKNLARWKHHREQILQIPDLCLFYDFEDENDGRVVNRADPSESGRLSGAKRSEGRWLGKNGCSFHRKNDAVALSVYRHMNSTSLCASFQMDTSRQFNRVLLGSRGTDTGNYVWQLFGDGSVQLAVRPGKDLSPILYRTAPIFKPSSIGAWYHLTTVLDASRKEVRTYLDDKLVDVQKVSKVVPLQLGEATLGNLLTAKRTATASHLNGRIDQLAIFNRALTDEEIRQMSLAYSQP